MVSFPLWHIDMQRLSALASVDAVARLEFLHRLFQLIATIAILARTNQQLGLTKSNPNIMADPNISDLPRFHQLIDEWLTAGTPDFEKLARHNRFIDADFVVRGHRKSVSHDASRILRVISTRIER